MFTNNRLFYFWCLLVAGIVSVSILPSSSWIYHQIASVESHRWVHFLAFTVVTAIPVGAWKNRRNILFPLVPILVGVAFELLQSQAPQPIIRTRNVAADAFGFAAGILLGLNIRVMLNSNKSLDKMSSNSSQSAI